MAKKCKFKFYSQSGKECVYPPSIGSEYCIWHDPEVKKDEEFVRIRLKSAIKETGGDLEGFLLRKANLSAMDLREVDLRDADLRESDLEDVDCSRADFRGAKLNRVYAAGANFEGANFMAANLSDGNFVNANFQSCNLRIVNLGHADVRGGDFTGSDVRNTDFSQTEQNDATNFANVTGITAKIIMAAPEPPAESEPEPVISNEARVDSGDNFPAAPAEAPPVFMEEVAPDPLAAVQTVEDESDAMFSPPQGREDVVDLFSDFHPVEEGRENISDSSVPQTKAAPVEEFPTFPPESSTGAIGNAALEAGSGSFPTAITSVGVKEKSEDETDFKLNSVGEDALTSRYNVSGGSMVKKILIGIVVLAVLGGGGWFGWKAFSEKTNGSKIKPPKTAAASAELKKEIKILKQKIDVLEKEITAKGGEADSAKGALAEKEKEIVLLNERILKLAAAASSTSDGELAALLKEKENAQKKFDEIEVKYKKALVENDASTDKILDMAAKTTAVKEKNDELVGNNKKLQQTNTDLKDRIKEGEEILTEYKKRLEEAEAARADAGAKPSGEEDPVLKGNPGYGVLRWGEYEIFSPKKTSYLVALKFASEMEGAFVNMTIMIFGEAPASKPNFRIEFKDADGNTLAKKYKINLSSRGLKFQQVLIKNQGWRLKGDSPKYIIVEFL